MKIDNSGKSLVNGQSVGTSRRVSVGNQSSASSSAATGSSSVSANDIQIFSAKLKMLETSMTSQPAFDAARVEEIRDAIANGKFKVRPDAIADKLVENVKQLLSKQNGEHNE
ncbi:flagellar biosynthesis anti-sigma factor FlgM [Burkholderiaceae bacterium DAT-1]|nr:flagellar biosynthesis anti-sigma factor FlgM [Burkholderiaceae bacterium DAT-1]